jgi:serine/threonine-protein kinase
MTDTANTPTIPGYEILGELGRGGMAVVYQARQACLNRVVALKILQVGSDANPAQLGRFKSEAEALAQLKHPNIVQIYDVGAQGDRPYFALELMDGGSLEKRLAGTPQPARLAAKLVETLARAMHVVHQKGIVHRDMKPANVLLREGVNTKLELCTPMITDFGLAKRLDVPQGLTRSGVIMGTPSYMAAEQAKGRSQEIGPATDVYALGAILYEMLTGRPPFLGENLLEILRQVEEEEPVPPRRLQPNLPRDMETICLKCLQKEPGNRYASAEVLAEDLRRFLAGETITARPTPAWERAWKLARRRPAVATLVTAVAGLILGIFVILVVYNGRLWEAKEQAEAHAKRADEQWGRAEDNLEKAREAVKKYFTLLSEDELSKEPGTHALRKKLLQAALEYYQGFLQQHREDPIQQAEVAVGHMRVGYITKEIGTLDKALVEYQHARKILENLVQINPSVTEYQDILAKSFLQIGFLQWSMGKVDSAFDADQQAVAIWEKLVPEVEPSATAVQMQNNLAKSYNNIGLLKAKTGRPDEAQRWYQKALTIREKLANDKPSVTEFQEDLAASYFNLGILKAATGKPAEARDWYQKALAIREKLAQANPAVTEFQNNLAASYNNIGVLEAATGRPTEALGRHQQALVIREKLAQANPAVTEFQDNLAGSHFNIGNLQRAMGKSAATWQPAEALRSYQQALAVLEKLAKVDPTDKALQNSLAKSYNSIGKLQAAAGKLDEARDSYKKALDIRRKLAQDEPTVTGFQNNLAATYNNMGGLETGTGKLDEAWRSYQQALDIRRKLAQDEPTVTEFQNNLAASYFNLGLLQAMMSKPAEARGWYQKALAIQEKLAQDNRTVTEFQNNLAASYFDIGKLEAARGKPAEARGWYQKALAIREKLVQDNRAVTEFQDDLAKSYATIGNLQRKAGEPAEARGWYQKALIILEKLTQDSPAVTEFQEDLAKIYGNLGLLENEAGKPAAALGWYKKSQAIWEKLIQTNATPYHSGLGQVLDFIGLAWELQGQHEKALTAYQKAIDHQRMAFAKAPKVMWYRQLLSDHYTSLARLQRTLNRPTEASAASLDRRQLWPRDRTELYNVASKELYSVACELALCVPLVAKGKAQLTPAEQTERQKYANLAMGTLEQAIDSGFNDVEHMKKDKDLDPLRSDDNFKKLLQQLEDKAKKKGK